MQTANMYLNDKLIHDLREEFNEDWLMCNEEAYKPKFSLCCALMDRIDSCISFLNEHAEYPAREMDFLCFMMSACILVDAQKTCLSLTESKMTDSSLVYFRKVCEKKDLKNVKGKNIGARPSDDEFFEHLRSLVFAHPFNTDHANFIPKGTKLCSPFVLVGDANILYDEADKGDVGIQVYRKGQEGYDRYWISFESIKAYVKSRYERIISLTQWIVAQKELIRERWKTHSVNRKTCPSGLLLEMKSIIQERHWECGGYIEDLHYFLTCPITNESNASSVNEYRKAIVERIPSICDALDSLDMDKLIDIVNELLFPRPKSGFDKNLPYHLANIQTRRELYETLNVKPFMEGTKSWGWVTIDLNRTDAEEIRLLVSTSCYLEKKKQEDSIKPI